ncbi:MAG: YfhO family protein, partial [bacterium]|nr:YfhO family protein [bacterium]
NPRRSYQGGLLYIPSVENCDWEMLSKLNVKYLITVNEVVHPNLELVFHDRLKIYRNKTMFPRAYFIPAKPGTISVNSRLRGNDVIPAKAGISKYSPNRIEVTVNTDSSGQLVLSELVYPGWRVYVDGKEKRSQVANDIFRAVSLDPGNHQVEFIYSPREFRYGALISITTLLACLSALLVKLIINKKKITQITKTDYTD